MQEMIKPVLIAHRGGAAEVPENTMAAFRHAVEVGARYVELDAQMTRDGELVVIHDETVDRTTNGSGAVKDFTYAELRKLDAGFWFDPKYAGEVVPTLREVLNLCVAERMGVVIELKSPDLYPGIEREVASLVGEMWLRGAEAIWCISFDHDAIRRMREIEEQLPLGYLFIPGIENFAHEDGAVQATCPYYMSALQHPEQVAQAHEEGKYVFVYTVNDEDEIRRLAEIGVDGMVTDRPAALISFEF